MSGLAVKPGVLNQIQSCLVVCDFFSYNKSIAICFSLFFYLIAEILNFLGCNDEDDDEVRT